MCNAHCDNYIIELRYELYSDQIVTMQLLIVKVSTATYKFGTKETKIQKSILDRNWWINQKLT